MQISTNRTATVLMALALAPFGAPVLADVVDVPGDAPTIQIAINLSADGDEIVVAAGTYFEKLDLLGKEITLRSSGGPTVTIIDALGQLDSAIDCVSGETLNTVIEGFTIRNGEAFGSAGNERGGGAYVNNSSATFRDCVFEANTAQVGGAIYINNGTLSLEDCRFVDNEVTARGGAIYTNNAVITIDGGTFNGNHADQDGGAIFNVTSNIELADVVLDENSCLRNGGAFAHASGTATVDRCIFTDSVASNGGDEGRGGAVHVAGGTFRAYDSIFAGNACNRFGGVNYVAGSSTVRYERCTFVDNSAGSAFGVSDGFTLIFNSIIWNSGPSPVSPGEADLRFSNVEGGYDGIGNIALPPMFVDEAGRDFRLTPASPCIDAGDTQALSGAAPVDFFGNLRAVNDPSVDDTGRSFLNLAIDMGAIERQVDGGGPTCSGDLDGNGVVNGADLAALLGAWGMCP